MRIGFFADMYLPHVSGVTNHIAVYKTHFEHLGHEVFIFTFGDTDYTDAEDNVIRSPGLRWGSTGWQLSAGYSQRAREIAKTLDVAHVHHPFQSGHFACPLAREAGIPLVFTNHTRYDLYSDAYAPFVPHSARYAFLSRNLHAFARECDLVIAPSQGIAEWLDAFAGYSDAVVIPNGIDVPVFASPSNPVPRAELGISGDDVVFCYAGRLGAEKHVRELAREFVSAAKVAPFARLLMLGNGPERSAVEQIFSAAGISDRVKLAGMIPYPLMPGYLAASDVFITASVSEAHPLVVIEALAAGLPVIAISSPGITDTVTTGQDGLLAEDAEPGALRELIAWLAKDAGLRRRLADGARETGRSYTLENTADVLLGRYARLISGPRA